MSLYEGEVEQSTGRFYVEVAGWAAIAIIAWAITAKLNLFDRIVEFSRAHERWQIDEAFTLIVIVSITAFFASLLQSRHQRRRRRLAERDAFMAARRDVLTDLPNRKMFTELAGRALGEAWRRNRKCAVLFIDLDGFKPVNDTYGHTVGDKLLIAVSELLRDQTPQPSLASRLGGDEFAVLLPDIADDAAAVATAERILRELQQPFAIEGSSILVNATIGIAAGPQNGRRAEDLIHAADLAMYEAKRSGKGTVRVFSPKPQSRGADAAHPRAAGQGPAISSPVQPEPA